MKFILTCFLSLILSVHSTNAQKKKSKSKSTKTEKIHMYFDEQPKPSETDLMVWTPSLMSDMRALTDISTTEVNLTFVVEKNGSITGVKINSTEWKPSKDLLSKLTKLINSKEKWIPAKINKKNVRGQFFLKMKF